MRAHPPKLMLLGAATVALLLAVPGTAFAYYYTGVKWASATVPYYTIETLTSTERSYAVASCNVWNGLTNSTWKLQNSGAPVAWWGKKSFSAAGWPSNIPGRTLLYWNSSNRLYDAESYINSNFTWNNTGVMDQAAKKADYKTVMIHETGHWAVLDHPSAIGQSHPEAVMEPTWTKKWALAADDKNGIAYIY